MLNVSNEWKIAMGNYTNSDRPFLTPKTDVILAYNLVSAEALLSASVSCSQAAYSDKDNSISGTYNGDDMTDLATLELNNFILDGSKIIWNTDDESWYEVGFIGALASNSSGEFSSTQSFTINFDDALEDSLPGVTITWAKGLKQYASSYKVEVFDSEDTLLKTIANLENTELKCWCQIDLTGVAKIVITILKWSFGGFEARIDNITFGSVLSFSNSEIINYEHKLSSDLNTLTLPLNQIKFDINNLNGDFNPDNSKGLYGMLAERQKVDVYYGLLNKVNHEYYQYDTGTPYSTEQFRGYKNQLFANGNFEDTSEWGTINASFTVNGNIATLTFDSSGENSYVLHASPVVASHKYYTRFYCKGNIGAIPYSNGFCPDLEISTDGWEVREAIKDDFVDSQTMLITTSDYSTLQLKNVMLIDLTLMFGAGNEPSTVAEAIQNIKSVYGDEVYETHKIGTFYTTEWSTPQNGFTASFTASSITDLMDTPFTFPEAGIYTFTQLATSAFTQANLPINNDGTVKYHIHENYALRSIDTTGINSNYTCGAIIQLIANAEQGIIKIDEDGDVYLDYLDLQNAQISDYVIDTFTSYKNPEYVLSKQLKNIKYNNTFDNTVSNKGVEQQITNPFITTQAESAINAVWLNSILGKRKEISGEFRSDPRLQTYDYILAKNKYSNNEIYVTEIDYTYNGCFKGSYKGKLMRTLSQEELFGDVYSNEIKANEVR